MRGDISRLLFRCGTPVSLVTEAGTTAFSAVLQPVTSVSLRNMQKQMDVLGKLPSHQFLYVGDRDISSAAYLLCGGERYLPKRCEPICFGGGILCYWGLAVKAGKENV